MHLSRDQWLELAQETGHPHVTLTLPLEYEELTSDKNRIRLKNLAAEADRRLAQRRMRSDERRKLLAPVQRLVEAARFGEQGAQGLVVLLAPGREVVHWCRHRVPESVRVSDRFDLSPILDHLLPAPTFWVLSLEAGGLRLLRCKPDGVREVPLPSAPRDLDDATRFDVMPSVNPPRHAQRLGDSVGGDMGGPARTSLYGFGHEDRRRLDLEEYLRGVEAAIRKDVGRLDGPLVLACVERVHGLWRELFGEDACWPRHLPGNPERRTAEQLRDEAWAMLKPHLEPSSEEALQRFFQARNEGRAARAIREVLEAAANQRIDTLLWQPNGRVWGHFDPQGRVERVPSDEAVDDAVDLTGQVVAWTVRNGGAVVRVDELPDDEDSPFAAILRW